MDYDFGLLFVLLYMDYYFGLLLFLHIVSYFGLCFIYGLLYWTIYVMSSLGRPDDHCTLQQTPTTTTTTTTTTID